MSYDYKEIQLGDWVKAIAMRLQRIDERITSNIEKYKQRKRLSQSQDEQMAVDQSDQICEDWRKLNQIHTVQVPYILNKFSKNKKTIKRVNTIKTQLQRLIKKIQSRIDINDVQQYRSKYRLKNWSNPNTKRSKLMSYKSQKRSSSFQQLLQQNEQQFSMQKLKQIGKDNLKRLQIQVQRNSGLVQQYDKEKQQEKVWFLILIIVCMLLFFIFNFVEVQINTDISSWIIDFVTP